MVASPSSPLIAPGRRTRSLWVPILASILMGMTHGCGGGGPERPAAAASRPGREAAAAPDSFRFRVTTGSALFGCEAAEAATDGVAAVTGGVTVARGGTLSLETCPPTADCSTPRPVSVDVDAAGFPGFERLVPLNGFVRVSFEVRHGEPCRQRMLIEGLASWEGEPNPAGEGDVFHFAGTDGFAEPVPGAPFSCRLCPGGVQGAIRLRGGGSPELLVPSGTVREWRRSPSHRWRVRSLRAGACGRPEGWAYWVAGSLRS
jgi:hypothetical protein